MIRITVLGTSGAAPTRERNLTSVALVHEGDVLIFDCGEGTQRQILKYGINSYRIKAIFLSHTHGDHVIGIAGLVRTLALNNRKEPLYIFVPQGFEKVVKSLIVFDKAVISYQIIIKGVKGGQLYKGKDYTVSAFKVNHTIPTYGYVFKINDRRNFDGKKAKALGIKGPMFSELMKKGRITIGKRTVRLGQVSTVKVGKKIVFATDTRPVNATVAAAKNADLLIHESTYADAQSELARDRGHATSIEAATIAKKAKVSRLLLLHISARYRDAEQLRKEADKVFKGAIVADDGYNTFI
jgi:ribonuclease Z